MAGKRTANLALTVAVSAILLASVFALAGLQSALASSAAESEDDSATQSSGNVIINYIYEIELENKDNPKLQLNETSVPQGESFSANGTNFDANSTADISIFSERLFSLNKDGQAIGNSVALLLTKSNLTIASGDSASDTLVIENAEADEAGTGSVILATKVSPADFSPGEYAVALECEQVPNGESTRTTVSDPLVIDNSSSRQFFEFSLTAGEYEQCEIAVSPADDDDQSDAFESSLIDFRIKGDSDETSTASTTNTTNSDGSFIQNITVSSDAEEGRYVLMSETRDGEAESSEKRAIAPLTITGGNTTVSIDESSSGGSWNGDDDRDSDNDESPSPSNATEVDDSGNGTAPPIDDGTPQGPAPPPDTSGGDGGHYDPCEDAVTDTGNVNNTIVQSASQSASNTVSDDDVINVVQKIHGRYNGDGNLTTNVSVDDSDSISQTVRQHVSQQASIKNCYGESGESGNQTNSIDMNATQLASNAYSDNTTIVIVQTIIYPKDCDTNVDAPVSISDRDTVGQSIDQGIGQSGSISYGGSGEGSNTVVQSSMQVSSNSATNDEVITINQVIIVPPDCPVEIHAPVVVESNDDVHMSVAQTSEQSAAIDSGAGGVTILSSVEGSDQVTNTVVAAALQDGQNSFSDNDTITIEQNVYYVNDTSGWTEDNYEKYLEEEFGNETAKNDANNNSTGALSNATEPGKKWKNENSNATANGAPEGGSPIAIDGENSAADGDTKKKGQPSGNSTGGSESAGNSSMPEADPSDGNNTYGGDATDNFGNATSTEDDGSGESADPPVASGDTVATEEDPSTGNGDSDGVEASEAPPAAIDPVELPPVEVIPEAPAEPINTDPAELPGSEENGSQPDDAAIAEEPMNEPVVFEEPEADNSTSGS